MVTFLPVRYIDSKVYSWFGIEQWLNSTESLIRATTESLDGAQNWIYCERDLARAWCRGFSLPDCFDPEFDWKWVGSFVPRLQFGRHQFTVSGSFWLHIELRLLVPRCGWNLCDNFSCNSHNRENWMFNRYWRYPLYIFCNFFWTFTHQFDTSIFANNFSRLFELFLQHVFDFPDFVLVSWLFRKFDQIKITEIIFRILSCIDKKFKRRASFFLCLLFWFLFCFPLPRFVSTSWISIISLVLNVIPNFLIPLFFYNEFVHRIPNE